LEELQLAGVLLDEQIEDAVAVDVEQLRPRMLEAAEEWECVLVARGVEDWEGRDAAVEDRGGRGGRGR